MGYKGHNSKGLEVGLKAQLYLVIRLVNFHLCRDIGLIRDGGPFLRVRFRVQNKGLNTAAISVLGFGGLGLLCFWRDLHNLNPFDRSLSFLQATGPASKPQD